MRKLMYGIGTLLVLGTVTACFMNGTHQSQAATTIRQVETVSGNNIVSADTVDIKEQTKEVEAKPIDLKKLPDLNAGEKAQAISKYIDINGDTAVVPKDFTVSEKEEEQVVNKGLVIIGTDGSEFVWIPTTKTELEVRDFGSYFLGRKSLIGYRDEKYDEYMEMLDSTVRYGGFYIGRYEASKGEGNIPLSKRVSVNEAGNIWVRFAPQDTSEVCRNMYADNESVQGFFPWGINWDTMLQWIIDSGAKTEEEVKNDSSTWGNYSNDTFSVGAIGKYTGVWEETKANNIYDLAGNNWEWTRERYGAKYSMRGGGYNLMGGACEGSKYPAALRNPLEGNSNHPNVTFRVALHIK